MALTVLLGRGLDGQARAQAPDDLTALNAQLSELYHQGKYAEATVIAKRSLALAEKALGRDHLDVGQSLHNLAELYRTQGRYGEAEPLYKRSLALRERVLGPDHRDVGLSLNNLAGMYESQGRYGEAEPLFKRSVSILEKSLGPDHPDVGTSLNNLARMYRAQGRYGDAEPLYQRCLVLREKALGPDHPDVGGTLNNLGGLYQAQGRYGEAERLYKRSLAIIEKALGPDHPDVGTALNNLAELYRAQGRYGEAEPLYKRAVALYEKALGLDHPWVGTLLSNIAELYRAQGRYSEAEPLCKRSLALRDKALGPDHPDVGTALNNLALLYQAQGRYAEAEPLYKRSLALYEKGFGLDHPNVGAAIHNLAGLYQAQGRYADAEPLYKRGLALREKSLGWDHPDVGQSLNNLAGLYQSQHRYSEAELLYKRSIALREKALGPDHSEVGTGLNNLAGLYYSQGRYGEAEPLYKRALAIAEEALGPDHPNAGNARNNLAGLYHAQRRYAEAEPLYKRSLALREKALGPDHPDVGTSLNNLAGLYFVQSEWARAAEHWRRATAIIEHRSGRSTAASASGFIAKGKSEAEQNDWYFWGLVKSAHRLATIGKMATPVADTALAREMFETAQWGHGSEAADSLAQMAARSASGSPKLAVLVRDRQDLVAEWQKRDETRTAAVAQSPDRRDAQAEAANAAQLTVIDARIGEIDHRLKVEFPDYAALTSPTPLPVADVQRELGPDEALVLFLDTPELNPTPEETFVWVITESEVRWVRSGLGTPSLKREVAALRCGLDATGWSKNAGAKCAELLKLTASEVSKENVPLPFDATRAHALYKALFGEVEDIIKGKHLLIVSSGPLTLLPFQVLVTAPPAGGDNRAIRWLVRDHALTVLPAVSSLKALRRVGKPSAAGKQMIGFGNPLLDGNQNDPKFGAYFKEQSALARAQTGCAQLKAHRTNALRGLNRSFSPMPSQGNHVDVERVRHLAPLPETADELCAVARDLKTDLADIRLGARATETEVKAMSASGALAQYRVLHFATHGALAGQLSHASEPGLILTPPAIASEIDDGYLSASEIAGLKLDADWVILSACNTAGGAGKEDNAEALSGLARAFFYAQARALLVSHWEVDSAATVKLITGAVGETVSDPKVGRSEALRRAMLTLIDKGEPHEAHPSYWAPFVVGGEGGARP